MCIRDSILIFLALLGIVVSLITKSGASKAYGDWASQTIKSKKGALFATIFLGALIFVDDYFNCLTVGTVMRPVTAVSYTHLDVYKRQPMIRAAIISV